MKRIRKFYLLRWSSPSNAEIDLITDGRNLCYGYTGWCECDVCHRVLLWSNIGASSQEYYLLIPSSSKGKAFMANQISISRCCRNQTQYASFDNPLTVTLIETYLTKTILWHHNKTQGGWVAAVKAENFLNVLRSILSHVVVNII